jgi:hypothetical protein
MDNGLRNLALALALIFTAGVLGCPSISKSPPSISPPTSPSQQPPEAESRTGESASSGEAEWSGAKTSEERRDGLDKELDESLREFDEMLSREQQQTNEAQQQAAASGGQGSGGTGEESDATGGDNSGGVGSQGGVPAPGSGPVAPTPNDIPDGSDDDIVARQLREAAQQESDPELREKLWDEYRKYKTGRGKEKDEDR